MRAVTITKPGGPEVLTVTDRPVRAAGPGEVRIAVKAAAVNPTDVLMRENELYTKGTPGIPGMDAAGVVESAGEPRCANAGRARRQTTSATVRGALGHRSRSLALRLRRSISRMHPSAILRRGGARRRNNGPVVRNVGGPAHLPPPSLEITAHVGNVPACCRAERVRGTGRLATRRSPRASDR
jgi:hypothetical protein